MTVKELIEELKKYDQNLLFETGQETRVNLYDSASGHIDLTEVYETKRTPSPISGYTEDVVIIY